MPVCNYKKKLKSNPKQPSCKLCDPQEGHCEKRCEIQVEAKKWLDGRFNNDNSGEFGAKSL